MLATMQKLGVVPSFSRPSVSNDNPYSEALFKTLKYAPAYPFKLFESLDEARQWVLHFVDWYNNCHRHSGIKYVTPAQRHHGDDVTILEQRKRLYDEAKKKHPERWSGKTRNWLHESTVSLNPGNTQPETMMEKVA
ncbi:Integrase core domain-containing protein [Nitrosomonas sp. Nm34]|nr:Integrase core domain-containing protein [Nitrosomonas sp. Nm34]